MEKKLAAIRASLAFYGYTEDRYGHMKQEKKSGLYRYKFQAQTIRFEKYLPQLKEWRRLRTHNIIGLYTRMKPYIDKGFVNRDDYLKSLFEDYPREQVIAISNLLGPAEDFDGLITALEDANA